VLVAAPTGSGKTVVAEYAVGLAHHAGRRAFYTTPLKALSNQKFTDLQQRFGSREVGLLTGDNSVRGDAPIVVMTTEVLRNMIYEDPRSLDALAIVVLDEVHYLQDVARGAVWEEVIVHLPAHVRLVSLSATVSNAEEFADWIQTVRGETDVVIEEQRPVELVHLYAARDRANEELVVVPTFVRDGDALVPNSQAVRLDRAGASGRRRSRYSTPWRVDVLDHLAHHDLLPAIFFVFSRAGCNDAVEQAAQAAQSGLRLTDRDERRRISEIADRHLEGLTDDDLDALGYPHWMAALEQGIAAHHAGIVPPMKEAVEEAFAAGLVKVVFATETLALGVNMPARTVVIERLSKFTGERHEMLTPGEYTQLTGRAGRRGIDDIGYALVYWNPFVSFDQVAALASRRTYPLRSSFRPDYNMAVNLVRRYDEPRAHHLLSLSFAQYHADRDIVVVERRLERERAALARRRAEADAGPGDIAEYRRLVAAVDDELRRRRDTTAPHQLRPGDVLAAPRYGPVVVLRPGTGGGRVMALTRDARTVRLARRDVVTARRTGHLALPRPFRPNHEEFRRAAAERLVAVAAPTTEREPLVGADPLTELRARVAAHPAASDPALARRLDAAREADRLEQRVAKLERRLSGRSDSLARQLDRVLDVLRAWGYVEGWGLTPAGELLARLYSESDLLVAESIREGLLDGLTPEEMAGAVSAFTYRRRGPDGDVPVPPRTWPTARLRARLRGVEEIGRDLALVEQDARLPLSPPPDPGLAAALYEWATGHDLGSILDAEEMTGGDFVRNVKQVVDLLRQIADHAPDPDTGRTADHAADACLRGIVAASTFLA
jgi:ATP-dependent RNA helicase HelY